MKRKGYEMKVRQAISVHKKGLSLPHTRFLPSIRALLLRLALLFERGKKIENEYVGEKANGREAGGIWEVKV